jgi:hypothetical protein
MDFQKINYEQAYREFPTLQELTGVSISTDEIDPVDPIGLNHYSFFENCNIDNAVRLAMEREINYSSILSFCLNEEASIFWINKLFNFEVNVANKLLLLNMMGDEYKHFLIYFQLLNILFPEKNSFVEANKLKLTIEKNLLKTYDTDDKNSLLFEQFADEGLIATIMTYQYKFTKSKFFKQYIKIILADETKHLNLPKRFEKEISKEEKEKFKNMIIQKMKRIINTGIGGSLVMYKYKTVMESHGLDIKKWLPKMQSSEKAKYITTGSVLNLFKLAINLKLIDDSTSLEELLVHENLYENYKKYL